MDRSWYGSMGRAPSFFSLRAGPRQVVAYLDITHVSYWNGGSG